MMLDDGVESQGEEGESPNDAVPGSSELRERVEKVKEAAKSRGGPQIDGRMRVFDGRHRKCPEK
jgi:hypothetical protein